jgi:Flp pilus assembly pilin Flp
MRLDSINSRSQEGTEPRRRWFRRDDESGLTTLEWLLIVAAVAGLAALAVVLVTNVVDDTSEQISGSSARGTAARIAATEITQEAHGQTQTLIDVASRARNNGLKDDDAEAHAAELIRQFRAKCENLKIIFSDIPSLEASWQLMIPDFDDGNQATVKASIESKWRDELDDTSTDGCQVSGI